ncbi:MAG: fibronectin type III domain-containing protein, partial [Planctomycetota bacterium]
VPYEKQESLHASVVAEALSIVYDILAAVCATNPFTAPAAPALKAVAIVHTAISIASYYQAEDPSENYTELVRLEDFNIPVPYEVNSLPVDSSLEGIAGRLALAALELASVEQACKESYARYDYAKTAQAGGPDVDYMALQLAAAKRYNAMAISKLRQVQFLSAVLTAHPDMPAPNDTHLGAVRSDLAAGLYPIQQEILEVFDYNNPVDPNDPNEADIVEVMLAATETPGRIGLYGDPNKLHEYHHCIIQDHYIADYALGAAAEAEELTDLINSQYPNDIVVKSVWTSACQVLLGAAVDIKVEVENHGTGPETFDVNVCAGTIALEPAEVNNLPAGLKDTVAFTWDTTDVDVGYYTIQAEAILRDVNDSFPADNTCRGRTIRVWDPFDSSAPGAPESLTETQVTSSSVSLSWTAPPDEDVAGYKVYRSLEQHTLGAHIGYAGDTYYTDTAVSAGTYWYRVKAYDVTGRESPASEPCEVTVP